jgi:type I restriction-modification system DNA methylase subunit
MHYTSVDNIHKVIDPLFLDDLRERFEKCGDNPRLLRELQRHLSQLTFLDPACGSGNFLTQTYLELRHLENEILKRLSTDGTMQLDLSFEGEEGAEESDHSPVQVNVGQFYGIEVNDFAVSVAQTALWIADHQANVATSRIIGREVRNLPLKDYHHIVQGNALRMDWNEVLPAEQCSFIMGNPPFLGARNQSKDQKQEVLDVYDGAKNAGNIDYVAAWFMKSAKATGGGALSSPNCLRRDQFNLPRRASGKCVEAYN